MSNRLAVLRRSRGWTQDQLAQQLGITRTYLSDLENNKHEAGTWIALKAAHLMGVPVEKIFRNDEVEHP
ncbi:MAG: helix-turn-helix transcriptional regulator [Syntrophomonadaceae bacterium]